MNIQTRQINTAIRHVRKGSLKALEKAANKCLALFPAAESDPATARLVLNIVASQAHESLDLFLRQFATALDNSLGESWLKRAESEIADVIEKVEKGVPV